MARLHRRVTRAIFCLFVLRTLRTHSFPELKKSESVRFGYFFKTTRYLHEGFKVLGKTAVPFGKLDMDVLRQQEPTTPLLYTAKYEQRNFEFSRWLTYISNRYYPVSRCSSQVRTHCPSLQKDGWKKRKFVEALMVRKRTYPIVSLRLSRRCCFVSYNAITTLTSLTLDVFYGKRRRTWKVFDAHGAAVLFDCLRHISS